MSRLLQFPTTAQRFGFQPVRARYSVREISHLFGLTPQQIRKWTEAGLIRAVASGQDAGGSADSPLTTHHSPLTDEPFFGFRALAQFRRVRELRDQGLTLQQIEGELRGQFNLFAPVDGQLIALPLKPSLFERALELHEQGDPRAAEAYRAAINTDDCVPDAYCNLGLLEHERGSVPNARECFSLALERDERHFEAHYNLGTLYFDEDELALSRIHYEAVVQVEPNFSHTYFNLGLVFAQQELWFDARRTLRRFQHLAPAEDAGISNELLRWLDKVVETSAATPAKLALA